MSIFGMAVVDTWLLFKECTETQMAQKEFYMHLVHALIDDKWSEGPSVSRSHRDSLSTATTKTLTSISSRAYSVMGSCGPRDVAHLTPNQCGKQKRADGCVKRKKAPCAICKRHTIRECRMCRDMGVPPSKRAFCDPALGSECFKTHLAEYHP